jgi:hypothetical protein
VAGTDYAGLGDVSKPEPHPSVTIGLQRGARHQRQREGGPRPNLDRPLSHADTSGRDTRRAGQGALFRPTRWHRRMNGALVLRGVVAIAPVSQCVTSCAPFIPGTPGPGVLVMALAGLATEEARAESAARSPSWPQPARDRLPVAADRFAPDRRSSTPTPGLTAGHAADRRVRCRTVGGGRAGALGQPGSGAAHRADPRPCRHQRTRPSREGITDVLGVPSCCLYKTAPVRYLKIEGRRTTRER